MLKIKKVAVLGTGVMGSQIAAHLENAGIPSYNFDLTRDLAEKGLKFAREVKPVAFFTKHDIKKITPCSYKSDIEKIKECDWVIEVIGENIEWKYDLYKKIIPNLKNTAILTSNTSSLPISLLTKNFDASIKKRFFITHFFNPPRYLKLLELISGPKTDNETYANFVRFGENILGKTIVHAKDTPGFVANRIGVFGMMLTMELQQKYKIPIAMIDKFTGRLIARPKSATYRTADVVGLDTLVNVGKALYHNCPNDSERNRFIIPDFLTRMIEHGFLGQKTRKGFFKRDKKTKVTYSINFESMVYEPVKKYKYDLFRVAKDHENIAKRLYALVRCSDDAGRFMNELIVQTCMYAAARVPEIANDSIQVDNALRTGFAWDIGPFEILDMIGVKYAAEQYKKMNKKVPEFVQRLLLSGNDTFYRIKNGVRSYFDFKSRTYVKEKSDKRIIKLDYVKQAKGVIEKNWCASLIDIGDGVACLQFHSILQREMNPIDASVLDMLSRAPRLVTREGFKGMVIGHQGVHFSAGANLQMILELAKVGKWSFIEKITENFQNVNQEMRFAPFPIVAAPFNLTLGGGVEMCLATDKIVASAETYMGLVEVGVGLIPGGGGCLRLLMNWQDQLNPQEAGWGKKASGPFPVVQKAFETIAFAKVSISGKEGYELGYLRPHDEIIMNHNHLISRAKEIVLNLAENYTVPVERDDLNLPGENGRFVLEQSIDQFVNLQNISKYDGIIGRHVAKILTGGNKTNGINRLKETDILELERESFMSLIGEKLTQDRISHMLKTGKPLRN